MMTHQRDGDYERVVRWLLGLAERQVTVAGSRATFVSDMYFEAAECIEGLAKETAKLKADLAEAREIMTALLFTGPLPGVVADDVVIPRDAIYGAKAFLDRTKE